MREIISMITEHTSSIAGKEVDPKIVENSFLFVLSSISGMNRQKFKSIGGSEGYSNFFGITMANSGEGKDLSLSVCEEMFDQYLEQYPAMVRHNYEKMHGELPTGEKPEESAVIAPMQYKIPLRGSIQGMMRTANFYDGTTNGSLNVVSTEFGAEYNPEVLPLLTILWQSAKSDGSVNVNQMYNPVNDCPTNALMFGSPSAFKKNDGKHTSLAETISSGMGRRTNFVSIEKKPIISVNSSNKCMPDLKDYAVQIISVLKENRVIEPTKGAREALNKYKNDLIAKYNDTFDDRISIEIASIDKVERVASLIAIASLSPVVDEYHMLHSITMNIESFKAVDRILAPSMPYRDMYDLLRINKSGLSQSEMLEMGIRIKTKTDWSYQIDNLNDLARRKSKRIVVSGPRFILRDLEVSDLKKMIVSTSSRLSKNPEMEIDFTSQEVPFFGDNMSIERLVVSEVVQSYCLNHFEATDKARNGHRKKDYVIQGQNMIAFDIDNGMTIHEAKRLLDGYIYILYATKSHQKDKNGEVCDRFRIIMPTKTNYYVDAEKHKGMYENISTVLGITSYDVATRNQGRLWFTNPSSSEVYLYDKGELIDVRCCIPETDVSEKAIPNIEKLNTGMAEDTDEMTRRIMGMQKHTIINGVAGGRNDSIYKLAMFLKDIGANVERITYETNEMLSEPLPETEVKTILSHI